jgi:hypothetical protein
MRAACAPLARVSALAARTALAAFGRALCTTLAQRALVCLPVAFVFIVPTTLLRSRARGQRRNLARRGRRRSLLLAARLAA